MCRRRTGRSRADLHPRLAALRFHAPRADPGQPQPGGGDERTAIPRPGRDLAQSQPRRWHQLSRGGAGARTEPLPIARPRLPVLFAVAPPLGRPAVHRQDAQQLPARGFAVAHPAERTDHRRAAPPPRRVPQLLPSALRQGANLYLRPERAWRVLPAIPADDRPLGSRPAWPRAHGAVRGGDRRLREPGATPARVLRTPLGGRLPALLRERAAHTHPELGAGPPADLRPLGGSLASLRAAPRGADYRD